MNTQKRTRTQWFILALGLVGTASYFLHVIIGRMYYPGYHPVTQAVSDLTAAGAPSQKIASAFTQTYGICIVTLCVLLCVFFESKVSKPFRLGIYLFTAMQVLSAVGYPLFPLSGSGYAGAFQDVMHIVVTTFVVLFSIASMILIAAGSLKSFRVLGVITFIALGLMFIGSIGIGAFPAYFGIAERLNVYSVVLYSEVLSVFGFCTQLQVA